MLKEILDIVQTAMMRTQISAHLHTPDYFYNLYPGPLQFPALRSTVPSASFPRMSAWRPRTPHQAVTDIFARGAMMNEPHPHSTFQVRKCCLESKLPVNKERMKKMNIIKCKKVIDLKKSWHAPWYCLITPVSHTGHDKRLQSFLISTYNLGQRKNSLLSRITC